LSLGRAAVTEAEWMACDDPKEMLNFLWDKESDRKLRLFTVACCRCSRQLLLNKDHRRALELATRFADGQATEAELAEAYRQANELACSLYDGESEREIRRWAEAAAVANALAASHPLANNAVDAAWMINRAVRPNPDKRLASLLRDICGNPFRRWLEWKSIRKWPEWQNVRSLAENSGCVPTDSSWLIEPVLSLAAGIYADRAFDRLPVLGDLLEDAGCADPEILSHCRQQGEHVHGCWVVDLILGKE
jgi:hypothetical protein